MKLSAYISMIKHINKDLIINWCKKNLLNENLIINFMIRYGEYQLGQIDGESMKIFNWSSNIASNFSKQLTEYTLSEKIIRSFFFSFWSKNFKN